MPRGIRCAETSKGTLCGLAGGIALAFLTTCAAADAKGFSELYSFCSQTNCSDGLWPYAGVVVDDAGNLFGTTGAGGATCRLYGCGTVFKLAPDGTETVLHAFTAQYDGSGPRGGLIMDRKGNLYGTTASAGSSGCGGIDYGCGTVFRITPKGNESILYAFGGNSDGAIPVAGLAEDKAGNLYGTTSDGGGGTKCIVQFGGCGTVFKVTPKGAETVLYGFSGGSDGANPQAALVADKSGDLFGTTGYGGNTANCPGGISPGCGVVFEVAAGGAEKTLYTFQGGNDGAASLANLVLDKDGNLYGTTANGGSTSACSGSGCGTVFKVAPDGTETILYSFTGSTDGQYPAAGLLRDARGNLYGTTQGNYYAEGRSPAGGEYGTVFRLSPEGKLHVLYTFATGTDGANPVANLASGKNGVLYGTTEFSNGTVFKVDK